MGSVTLGLALIAKNEADNLPRLLESIDGAFDRVVLLDTGSTDDTIPIFASWAKSQAGMTFSVADWEWKGDFSDARNAADRLLLFGTALDGFGAGQRSMVDWRCWADCDDIIVGARNLRSVVDNAAEEVTAVFADYDYAQDPDTGQCVIRLRRERLVRTSYMQPWYGRVHEATPISNGAITHLPSSVAEWKHCKTMTPESTVESNSRNLDILAKWNEDEPNNARIVGYLGVENMVRGNFDEAAKYFYQYLNDCNPQWDQEHAQMMRKLFQALMILDRDAEARDVAVNAPLVLPGWTDSWLSLAEYEFQTANPAKAIQWAKLALEAGQPDTMLIINPLDYSFLPRKLIALSLGRMGQVDEALRIGTEALQLFPSDAMLVSEYHQWQSLSKREHTADHFVQAAQQLIAHDEQLKAQALLDCVPVFATDHPRVVQMRTLINSRLQWISEDKDFADHYEFGGSKPEDFIPDENVTPLCEYLPRTQFLLEGIKEQINAN